MSSSFVVLAAKCVGASVPELIESGGELPEPVSPGEIGWIHVIATDALAAKQELVAKYGLREVEVGLAVDPDNTADYHEHNDAIFLEVPLISRTDHHEEYAEVGFFLSRNMLISVSIVDHPAIRKRFAQWTLEPVPKREQAAGILYGILDGIIDSYFAVADAMQQEMSDFEDTLYEGGVENIPAALALKRRLFFMRRKVSPVRDVLNALLRRNHRLVPNELWTYFHGLLEEAARTLDLIDISRDMVSSMLEAHLTMASNRLNEVMKFLAVISTILMSVSLISGIYGMNFKHMPELGQVWGYPAILIVMALITVLELWYFKRRRWI